MGPSGSNQQNSRWIIVRDAARKQRLAELNRRAVEGYISRRREAVTALPEAQAKSQGRILDAVEWQSLHLHEAPAMVVACVAMFLPASGSFLSGLGAGGSIWPSVQNLLLAARGLGLGAALTTLALSDRDAFKAALEIPEGIEPVCLVPLGYPLGNFGPVARRPVEDVLRWDTWS
ncbi:MAG: nitroreductase family protein [Dehalococcoidia bacterium]